MYHYDAKIALEELQEEALLPHPVKLRDMILRTQLGPQDAQLLNHDFSRLPGALRGFAKSRARNSGENRRRPAQNILMPLRLAGIPGK